MAALGNAQAVTHAIRHVRQARQYTPDPVPATVLGELLEIARWTGSSRNSQPWEFVVIQDRETLRRIGQIRTPINWMAEAPLGIAIVLNGTNEVSEAYDEGRVTERLLIGAYVLGLGGGVAWFGDANQQAEGKAILGIPAAKSARSVVVLGYPSSLKDPRPTAAAGGRKPMADLVSYNQFGRRG